MCPEYEKKEQSAGLMHQLVCTAGLYNKCKNEGLIPVISNLILSAGHNNGEAKNLIDYIDFPDEFVKNTSTIEKDSVKYIYDALLPRPVEIIRTHFPFKGRFKAIAKTIVDQMPKPICCIRVRRTDMLIVRPETNLTVQDINNVLLKHTYASVYIMTDEKNKNFFNGIENKYQAFDFPELAKITDNYELFAIECCMRDICNIRIGMFTTHDDTEYFHDYLYDIYGIH
jgi:hypothetical protein